MTEASHQHPRAIYAVLEFPRAFHDLVSLLPANAWLSRLPAGDGHPVMTLPGYGSADGATSLLRRYIARWGYDVHPWGLGTNLEPGNIPDVDTMLEIMVDVVGKIGRSLQRIHRHTGQRISLVGWSLGGLYARQLAAAYPDLVRQVITLGTPFGDPRSTIAWPIMRRLRDASPPTNEQAERWVAMTQVPVTVPLTAIWSRTDGFVHPNIAKLPEGPRTENIHVCSSHAGFGVNPLAFYVVANRLAVPDRQWQPFERRGWRRIAFRG